MTDRDRPCKERIAKELKSTIQSLSEVWNKYNKDPDSPDFYEYGLSFDYVEPNTFQGQRRGYFRYQLSWGGPSDEFRYYVDERLQPTKITYNFMDWWDGAERELSGKNERLLTEIWESYFSEFAQQTMEQR